MGNPTGSIKPKYYTSFFERLSYGLYFFGQNIFYVAVAMFMLPYFTDLGIPAAIVGVVTLIVKVWDAINDPIFGGVVDKVKFKNGKFMPWLRISLVLMPLATILMFAVNKGLSDVVKVVWVTVAYMLWDTAFTMCDVPLYGVITTMTDNQHERVSIMSFGRTFGILGAILGMVFIPAFRVAMGGWLSTILALSAIGTLVMLPFCFAGKERTSPKAAEKDVSLKDMFKYVFSNKYLLIFFGALIIKTSFDISSALSMYIGRHIFGGEALMSLISLVVIVPTIFMGIFGRYLIKKFDKYNLYWWASLLTGLTSIAIFFFAKDNFMIYLALSFIRGVSSGTGLFLVFMFSPDCVEYGTYKTGLSATGSAFALQSFSAKVGAALATSVGAFALGAIGLVSGEGVTQTAEFSNNLWFASCWIPLIGTALSLIILRFYKLRDKDVEIMTQANYGKITREEAEVLLAGRNL